ncbi:hypothetical protein B0J11DRAFT_215098 [Dendryphion nanum]|uniref:Secreted protein n=1 Tax=Dendryphion nanum TaxID=256645 RepID=A0A9P9E7M9_9PLEO|nr:hypothetical protein B0J11DRAFT_215098 [Dendryphion nanum]
MPPSAPQRPSASFPPFVCLSVCRLAATLFLWATRCSSPGLAPGPPGPVECCESWPGLCWARLGGVAGLAALSVLQLQFRPGLPTACPLPSAPARAPSPSRSNSTPSPTLNSSSCPRRALVVVVTQSLSIYRLLSSQCRRPLLHHSTSPLLCLLVPPSTAPGTFQLTRFNAGLFPPSALPSPSPSPSLRWPGKAAESIHSPPNESEA